MHPAAQADRIYLYAPSPQLPGNNSVLRFSQTFLKNDIDAVLPIYRIYSDFPDFFVFLFMSLECCMFMKRSAQIDKMVCFAANFRISEFSALTAEFACDEQIIKTFHYITI